MRYGRLVLAALLCLIMAILAACSRAEEPEPPPRRHAWASGAVPISPAGDLGQFDLSSSSYAIANRFVLDDDLTIDRWYYAINGEGADCIDGRDGYGSGDGGIEYGRIVEVDQQSGLPTGNVLGAEQVNGCEAHERAEEEFGLNVTHQVHYVQFAPATLKADRMYAFVLSNVHPDPGDGASGSGNHMSANLNFADLDDMGPHGTNTLDPRAAGAAYGLGPRETTMWSGDSGATWEFGDQVGWYDDGNGQGRMWPGGYRIAGGPNVPNGWSYMNWPGEGEATITYTAEADQVLVQAGGASSEEDVGVVSVRNIDTGESVTTETLGTGLVSGALSKPLSVAQGQRFIVRADGPVDTGSAAFWDQVFDLEFQDLARYESSCSACDSPVDHPMLYASPAPVSPRLDGSS
jgi:hypothetical protein